MTLERHLSRYAPALLSAAVLLILSGCAQPVQPAEDAGVDTRPAANVAVSQPASDAETDDAPVPARPERADSSPGQGMPSTTPGHADTLASLPGNWTLSSEGRGTAEIELSGEPGIASGDVTVSGSWPFATELPARWLYLAPDALTLVDEGGNIVWQGSGDAGGFGGNMEGGAPRAELTPG